MSEVDKKRAFNKLKHDLEPFRNVIVCLNSILTWEKTYYPAIVFGGISFVFLVLWLLDLSTVTMFSLLGLLGICADYGYPHVARMIFNQENWNGTNEEQFERVVSHVSNLKLSAGAWYEYLFNERKSTKFVIILGLALLIVAYIGAIINNLFLVYIITLVAALYPGISYRDIFTGVKDKLGGVVQSKIQQMQKTEKKAE